MRADTSVIAANEDDDGIVLVLECSICGQEYRWRLGLEEPPDCPLCGPDDEAA